MSETEFLVPEIVPCETAVMSETEFLVTELVELIVFPTVTCASGTEYCAP